MNKRLLIFLVVSFVTMSISACGSEKEKEETIDTNYKAQTNVTYSTGSESNWAYGNQRKEFSGEKPCYARISSQVTTDKGKNVDSEITVTYRFTVNGGCDVDVSENIAEKVESDDDNVIIYERIVNAKKEKNAEENIIVFRYTPKGATEITLDVIYDDHVNTQYDTRSTIYFDKVGEDTGTGTH